MSFNGPKPPPSIPAPRLGPLGIMPNEQNNLIRSVYLASGAENEPVNNNNNYSRFFNATYNVSRQPPLPSGPPSESTPPIGLVEPNKLIEAMLRGDRVYINRFPENEREFIRYFMKLFRDQYKIRYFFKDSNGRRLDDPYYWISRRNTRRSKKERRAKTRRHR